jgi:hypothetical protein
MAASMLFIALNVLLLSKNFGFYTGNVVMLTFWVLNFFFWMAREE